MPSKPIAEARRHSCFTRGSRLARISPGHLDHILNTQPVLLREYDCSLPQAAHEASEDQGGHRARQTQNGHSAWFCSGLCVASIERTNLSLRTQGWVTRGQMLLIHNGNAALVDSIISSKVSAGLSRPHPDAPHDPSATLYYACGS